MVRGQPKAPIALFVYNRPRHLSRTVEALLRNAEASESNLFIFSDAAKNPEMASKVDEVRQYINRVRGFAAVHIIARKENWGLARSIIEGVSEVIRHYGKVIVLEDDIVVSPYFLSYMNSALALYEHDHRVASIHAYVYPVRERLPETFFLRGADCWGWATWKRAWDLFESDGCVLLRELRDGRLGHHFDLEGAYPYTRMLEEQIAGKNDSWAIRWHASAFVKNKLTLYPGRSLVLNIGTDGSGTHCGTTGEFVGDIADSPINVELIPVEENAFARRQIARFYKAARPLMLIRAMRKLAGMLRLAK